MTRQTMIDPDDAAWFNPPKQAVREGEDAPAAPRPTEPDTTEETPASRADLFYGPV